MSIYNGTCGTNLTWVLDDSTGVLTISGTGDMDNWSSSTDVLWYDYRDNIVSIIIEQGVTSIGSHAFANCINLQNITWGPDVKSSGQNAFGNCTNLIQVNISNIAAWCSIDFLGGNYTNALGNPLYYARNLYLNGELVTDLTIPDGVLNIDGYVFYNCSNLRSVIVPDSVTTIGNSVFYNCSNLTRIELPNNMESIGVRAFNNCSSLESVVIPDGITNINNYTFYGCKNLTNIIIPDSVTSIGGSVFSYCESLTNITIPNSVKNIGTNAFSDCDNLKTFSCESEKVNVSKNVFLRCEQLLQGNEETGQYIINTYTNKKWLVKQTYNTNNIEIDNDIELICQNSLSVTVLQPIKIIFPISLKCVNNNSLVLTNGQNSVEFICKNVNMEFGVEGIVDQTLATDAQIILGYCLSDIENLENINDLISYADTVGYEFVLYYSTAEEKKNITAFKINNEKEINIYYLGKKGELDIKFNADTKCNLGSNIFTNRKIETLNLSEGVTSISKGALTGSITNQLEISYIGEKAGLTDNNYFAYLYGKDKFNEDTVTEGTLITGLPKTVVITSVNVIPDYAFSCCGSIENIVLPTNLIEVGDYAFYRVSFTSLDIPKTLSKIGNYAFYTESLTNINWLSYKSTLNEDDFELGTNGEYFYVNTNSNYPEVNGIKFLDENGNREEFSESSNEYTFDYVNGQIKDKNEPVNVVGYFSLPYYIFTSKLKGGNQYISFVEANGVCGDNLEYFLNKIDADNYSLEILGEGTMDDFGENNVPWQVYKGRIKEVTFSKKVTSIGNNAFRDCVKLEEVTFPASLQKIGEYTFYNCSNLSKVNFNDNLEAIENYAFCNCSNLSEINFNEKLKTIGVQAFRNCSLNSISLKGNILTVGSGAFCYNNFLTNVEIIKATSIGYQCFLYCPKLEKITLPFVGESAKATKEKGLMGYVLGGNSQTTSTNYDVITQIYEDGDSVSTIKNKIPQSLKEIYILGGHISTGAFSGMDKVEKITLDNAITGIGTNVFWGTEKLKEIKLPYKTSHNSLSYHCYYYDNEFKQLLVNKSFRTTTTNYIEKLFCCCYGKNYTFYEDKGVFLYISDRGSEFYVQLPLLEKVTITNTNLDEVGRFSSWNLENLILAFPDNISKIIPDYFFRHSTLKNLITNVIPDTYGVYSFYKSNIRIINNSNWTYNFSNIKKIDSWAFGYVNFGEDNDIKISSTDSTLVRYINSNSFQGSNIKSIEIDIWGEIGSNAFAGCTNLKRIKFSNRIYSIGKGIFEGSMALEEIIAPFVGSRIPAQNYGGELTSYRYSFIWWLGYKEDPTGYSPASPNHLNFGVVSDFPGYTWYYNDTFTERYNLKRIIITDNSNYIINCAFYDLKRWFPNLEIYFTNIDKITTQIGENAFTVYPNGTAIDEKWYYFKGEFDESEILSPVGSRAGASSYTNYLSEETSDVLNEQRVIKLLTNKDYSWKAFLYGKDYDVYITDNNTYSDGSSYLPTLYLPNNSRMEEGQQITLIGEDTYNIINLESFSCANKIFYRQSKGILNGKLSYFNTVTGLVRKSGEDWIIEDENFKASLTSSPVNFTIGSVYDSSHIDGTIKIENDMITIEKMGTEIIEADTITIEKALVTKGSIDADLLNVVTNESKFTTSADGQLQIVKTIENYYNIEFSPGFYISTNGYNSINITIADEALVLPNDLLTNTVLLSIEMQGRLTLEGTTGDNIKKGIISQNLIGIIKKGVTNFSLNDIQYTIKDVDKNNNQIIFEDKNNNGFLLDNGTVEQDIILKDFIDIADSNFDITDLHLTLNYINIFDVEKIEKYRELEGNKLIKKGEILYLITTKEPINPKDYEVLERSLEKEFTLERYTTIATIETLDKSKVQHILVYPDTFYEVKSNYIETPQYYFQTSEKQDIVFYINDFKVEEELSGETITNIDSCCAKVSAEYQGNLIWYKWTIQENIEGQYYTVKEFAEYYNPNIILNYDLFKNNTTYKLILTVKTRENLEVEESLFVNVSYGTDLLDNIVVDKDCIEKAIKISFLEEQNEMNRFVILREDVDDENSLCKLAEITADNKHFYDYSFNRELTYQYYIVPVYVYANEQKAYGPPHKLNNQINYNLKEVTLIDTIIDIAPNDEFNLSNIYEINSGEYSIWHLKYNTEAKNINIVTDKAVYETTMKIPVINKTDRNYKTGTIKAFLGGFTKENGKLTYRDSIKLQNKFQEFCDNGRVKMLRDEIGNVLPVDVTLTSFDYNPHTIPTNITITFEWTQVGEEESLSVWRSE